MDAHSLVTERHFVTEQFCMFRFWLNQNWYFEFSFHLFRFETKLQCKFLFTFSPKYFVFLFYSCSEKGRIEKNVFSFFFSYFSVDLVSVHKSAGRMVYMRIFSKSLPLNAVTHLFPIYSIIQRILNLSSI